MKCSLFISVQGGKLEASLFLEEEAREYLDGTDVAKMDYNEITIFVERGGAGCADTSKNVEKNGQLYLNLVESKEKENKSGSPLMEPREMQKSY